jgi:hypothetical protein
VKTVDIAKALGKPHSLWAAFAKFYERHGDLDNARIIFQKAVQVRGFWGAWGAAGARPPARWLRAARLGTLRFARPPSWTPPLTPTPHPHP